MTRLSLREMDDTKPKDQANEASLADEPALQAALEGGSYSVTPGSEELPASIEEQILAESGGKSKSDPDKKRRSPSWVRCWCKSSE